MEDKKIKGIHFLSGRKWKRDTNKNNTKFTLQEKSSFP